MNHFYQTYKNPVSVAIVMVILGGMVAFNSMQRSLFPEITFPKIKVIADAGEQPVDLMMRTVTRPMEMAIKKVPGLKTIRSSTSRGSCEISAFMDWKADINISQQRIESKINEIRNELPPETQVTVERMNPSILPVIGYTLESKNRSPIDLKYLATYTIKPFLSQVDGVSEVRVIGGKEKEYWVFLDQRKMAYLGITPQMISTTMEESMFIKSNGYLSDYRMLYLSVTNSIPDSKSKLENLLISNNSKRIVVLSDLATVKIREAKEYIKVNANGKEGILIAVVKQPDANVIELSERMESKLKDLNETLPVDVTIRPYYVQADFVHSSIRSVNDSLWIGLVLAILVAILFLRSLRASLTILVTIPVTMLLTLIVLYFMGETLNIMTLGALAASIGLIIDDAIVVMEQIHRTHEEHPGESSPLLIQRAIRYLFPAMVGSSLSTIVIFLPFTLMTGVAGAYFKVMTDSMIVILVCSFFVTWIGLPVIYTIISRGKSPHRIFTVNKEAHHLKTRNWVSYFIRKPWLSLGFVWFLLISMILVFSKLETGFLPEMDEGSIVLDYKSPPGTSLDETDRILQEVEKVIVGIPEVESYSRRTGTEMGFFITEPNDGDYLIQLKKDRKRTTLDVIDEIREKVETTQPALEIDFGQVIGDMLGDLMESVQPIEIKIFGNEAKKLEEISVKISGIISEIDGVADVFDGIIMAGPYVSVEPNMVQLEQYGITPSNLQYQVKTSIEGNEVGTVYEKERLTPVRIIYPGNENIDLNGLKQLQVFLPNGKLKHINDLANIRIIPGDAEIKRENLQNMGIVTARLDNRDLGSAISEIKGAIKSSIHLPQGYSIVYGGAYAEQQQSFRELLIILITSSLLVFCVILVMFKEFRIALIILFISVLGITGSFLALYFTGIPLNVGSYTGLIMIVGIIGENAIFTFQQFRKASENLSVDDSIIFAISTRLRPKLMTALGAITALLPIATGFGTGAQLHQPLAIAIIGGFLIALPLLLIVLPSFIRIAYRKRKF